MKIAIGADHGGYELKKKLKKYLIDKGYTLEDCGTHSTDAVDYPKYAYAVAEMVSKGTANVGIMIDGAGIGSCMTANKVPGVRAALCYDISTAKNSREHNDANMLTLGAGMVGFELAKQIVDVWLTSKCTVDRHKKRVAMITGIEQGGAPSPMTSTSTTATDLAQISPEDLQKVANRIQQLIGGTCRIGGDNSIVCTNGKNVIIHYGHPTEINAELMKKVVDAGADRLGYTPDGKDIPTEIAKYIDHTILNPAATVDQIKKLCEEARTYGFASVCVNPCYVKLCSSLLRGSNVDVCSVIGFPFGTSTPEIKAMETRRAIRDGAREIDMVINVGALKSGDTDLVLRDIRAVTDACRDGSALSKVIIEAALLTDDEKVIACQLSKKAGADFVKTSTGYGPGGATVHDVALMREAVKGTRMGIKAAGGIRSFADAKKMIEAGATRLGASAGVKISQEAKGVTVSN